MQARAPGTCACHRCDSPPGCHIYLIDLQIDLQSLQTEAVPKPSPTRNAPSSHPQPRHKENQAELRKSGAPDASPQHANLANLKLTQAQAKKIMGCGNRRSGKFLSVTTRTKGLAQVENSGLQVEETQTAIELLKIFGNLGKHLTRRISSTPAPGFPPLFAGEL